MGTLTSVHKEDLLKEVENQLAIGPEGLDEQEDSYWSAISMRWQLPQEKTKSTGC